METYDETSVNSSISSQRFANVNNFVKVINSFSVSFSVAFSVCIFCKIFYKYTRKLQMCTNLQAVCWGGGTSHRCRETPTHL